ncbi:uncharacterized protein LOC113558081 [Rhopalosiphum maidis]|uniref:uncharacterized protein LOC113558081 n=1 Tax=Rhopalosiphum maidis TaxID=43146 RepID=UPI000EFDBBF2|nr:uncharacterized protein LOC113558081 [Rhopalosiphum maidis]
MTCCAPDGDDTFLMPLKKRKHLRCPGDGQSPRERRCGNMGLDKCDALRPRPRSACAADDCDPAPKQVTFPGPCFEDSAEWQSTKSTAAGLFQALGQHYDEPWFPTVINEWSTLYYQCSHACDYWQCREEWLAGDEEVRLTIWSEVLKYREQHERQQNGCATEVTKTYGCPNKANDRFDLHHKNVEPLCEEDLPSTDERARDEAEATEIALADPDDNPDWVEMRRKMRGSFAALNVARCEVSAELLDHIMIELCKYWANAPETENSCQIDQQLERNIIREIQNFRFKLFDVAVIIEPEIQQRGPDACQEPDPCRKQEPCQKPEPCRKPEPCGNSEPCSLPESEPCSSPDLEPCARSEPKPCCPKKPESCCLREPEQCCPQKPESCCPPKPDSCRLKEPGQCCPQKPESCKMLEPLQKPEPCCPKKPEPCCPKKPEPCCPKKPEPCCPKNPELCCSQGPESYCSQNPVPCCPMSPPKPKCCARRRSTKTKLAEARARHNATQVRDRDVTTGWLGGNPHQ